MVMTVWSECECVGRVVQARGRVTKCVLMSLTNRCSYSVDILSLHCALQKPYVYV